MSDILVQKYQHYFNESVKLQETVNEQLAYITELEEALLALDEMAMTIARLDELEAQRQFTGDRGAIQYQKKSDEMESDKVHGLGGEVVGTTSPKGTVAYNLKGKNIGRVNVMGIVIPPPYNTKKNKK